jgi:hypothetical protein
MSAEAGSSGFSIAETQAGTALFRPTNHEPIPFIAFFWLERFFRRAKSLHKTPRRGGGQDNDGRKD